MADEAELVISTLDDIRKVKAADWDRMLGPDDSPFIRHAFLASLEEAGCVLPEKGWLPQHLLVHRGPVLVAAAPMYIKGTMEGEFVFDYSWERFAQRLGVKYYPKLVVSIPFTPATGRRLLVAPGEPREPSVELLARGVRAAAHQLKASSAHVLFPVEEDRAGLEAAGFAVRHGIQYHWHNRGYDSYDDFLKTFNAKRRHQLRREKREVEQSGLEVKTYRGREITEEVMDAMEAFYVSGVEKHFPWGRLYLNRRFFDLVTERMPGAIEIVLARDGGRAIAGAFNVRGSRRLYGRYWGATEQRPFLHFYVCYYHSIEQCILQKLEAFEPGAGGEHKLPRGFDPTLTFSAHHLRDPRLDRGVRQFLAEEREAIAQAIAHPGDE